MSDFLENNQELEQTASENEAVETENDANESFEESTVFSAPVEHKRKKAISGNKKRILSIVAAILAVSILVGGTLAIIKLIPEMTKDEIPLSDLFNEISVITADSLLGEDSTDLVSNVIVNNKYGEFKFIAKESYWTVDGVEYSKLSSAKLETIVSSAKNVTAIKELDKPIDECGFASPKLKFTVRTNKERSYTVLIGNKSPDNLGYYLMVEGGDKVYLAHESMLNSFEFSLLDLSDQSPIPKTVFNSDTTGNVVADGTYAYFDSMTLSGKLFPETITIVNNKDDSQTAALLPYLISTPMERYANAEALAPLVNLFSKSSNVTGNCALDVNEDTLKLFGLDNPDAVVTMTINGETKTFKFAIARDEDEEYCAVVYDGATMIRKADVSTFEFLSAQTEDYYYKSLFMVSINDISNLTVKDSEGTLKFDIDTNDGTADTNSPYIAKINGKDVSFAFQGYYGDFTLVQSNNFEVSEMQAAPSATITFTYREGGEMVVDLYKATATEYQYSIDGIAMGRIPSSEYNKILKNFKAVAKGENVAP